MKELLKQIIFEQQEYCKNIAQDTVPRDIEEEWLTTTEILIITGIRRCGKSVLLQQMRSKLPEQDFFSILMMSDWSTLLWQISKHCKNVSSNSLVSSIPIILMRYRM